MKSSSSKSTVLLVVALLVAACCHWPSPGAAQREDRDQDDFDDAGFDDSGYSSPQNHDAEGSHHQPSSSNYSPSSEEDLDDDDEVDESNNVANAVAAGPQQFYAPANSIVMPIPLYGPRQEPRQKRSVVVAAAESEPEPRAKLEPAEADIEEDVAAAATAASAASSRPLIRKRRYSKKYIGPVYTYVKTDKHAHYKWGVKHKVGKHLG